MSGSRAGQQQQQQKQQRLHTNCTRRFKSPHGAWTPTAHSSHQPPELTDSVLSPLPGESNLGLQSPLSHRGASQRAVAFSPPAITACNTAALLHLQELVSMGHKLSALKGQGVVILLSKGRCLRLSYPKAINGKQLLLSYRNRGILKPFISTPCLCRDSLEEL
ncbi:unnamed protein product [Pleuronectes platessa]|uniref:Uncharacterized protein n=1 Tax=Pleuronectes platessa TaxID=8262 RepID=A0A9N7ZC20_PLEPL|nr:unnamed protein product [Pleuronectes platessa]